MHGDLIAFYQEQSLSVLLVPSGVTQQAYEIFFRFV